MGKEGIVHSYIKNCICCYDTTGKLYSIEINFLAKKREVFIPLCKKCLSNGNYAKTGKIFQVVLNSVVEENVEEDINKEAKINVEEFMKP